jgi:2,4-dienoyl-CoA reductase-like NADH-dependent reductase (Old Yellow Enzyme family)
MTDAAVCAVGSVGLSTDIMETAEGTRRLVHQLSSGLRELQRRFARGDFDLVSVGRSNISDPAWVKKVHEGRYTDIRLFKREHLERPGRDNTPHVAEVFVTARKAEATRDARAQEGESSSTTPKAPQG